MINIRAVCSNLPPFVIVNNVNGSLVLEGFIPEIVRAVAKKMNLNITYIREPHDDYGAWENNAWTGMVGMLQRHEVDFVLNPDLPRAGVLEFAYFTNPITVEAYTILSGKKIQEAVVLLTRNATPLCVFTSFTLDMQTNTEVVGDAYGPKPHSSNSKDFEACST
ncbi:lig_chan-Glu_bd domain-containing protein [Trichonephila inaurata madagascariensis]|uniref:Lig_chan-Glu_bd domain-containing protein n=1 Tax=Trichonephila inaurata madagascariensis TaxID=2747483 RepID=A0A8X6MBB1_9ARAC|nr:lig_chan-Glu_bd domain-containing protein [Trichonephila inaurata madagascariensis]